MWVVVRLLDEPELLALRLVQARFDAVGLLQSLERQDEQLCVVLVAERRERDGREPARLEPVHRGRVDGHRLLRRDVRTVLQREKTAGQRGATYQAKPFISQTASLSAEDGES